ncbi:MAG: hypothetical protein ACI4G0_06250 [Ruminococcus sp.]
MNFRLNRFMKKLKNSRPYLSKQQYRTIKGQALSGDIYGAEKGLNSLLNRRCVYEHNDRNAACSR